jgi:hypothetical protein
VLTIDENAVTTSFQSCKNIELAVRFMDNIAIATLFNAKHVLGAADSSRSQNRSRLVPFAAASAN